MTLLERQSYDKSIRDKANSERTHNMDLKKKKLTDLFSLTARIVLL